MVSFKSRGGVAVIDISPRSLIQQSGHDRARQRGAILETSEKRDRRREEVVREGGFSTVRLLGPTKSISDPSSFIFARICLFSHGLTVGSKVRRVQGFGLRALGFSGLGFSNDIMV